MPRKALRFGQCHTPAVNGPELCIIIITQLMDMHSCSLRFLEMWSFWFSCRRISPIL
jgi:hypothetical protein